MGQTLTHGVYLPDEGERNCYAGLAANWQLLDSSVGTIAEHTSALAGKAPAVHTHTKADITDLLNSANTWTGDNTYSKPVAIERNTDTGGFLTAKNTTTELGSLPSSDKSLTLAFKDKNNDDLCYARVYYETTGGNSFRIFVRNKYTSGAPSTSGTVDYAYFGLKINADKSKEAVFRASLRPYDSTYNYHLGDSTYKWKTLNGVNPGALSLPDYDNAIAIDTTSWSVPGSSNSYTPVKDGWLCVITKDTATSSIFIFANLGGAKRYCGSVYGNGSQGQGRLSIMFPVRASVDYIIVLHGDSASDIYAARFYPCLGNV